MSTVGAYGDLRRIGSDVLTTREAAVRLGTSISNASRQLKSMSDAGVVLKVRRGLWSMNPDIDPLALPHYLTSPFPAYASLWTALSHHDMIEQIPRRIHVASLARSQRIGTTIAEYSVHHITPEVFGGFTGTDASGYMATPEKALFDAVYVRASRGGPMHMPDLSFPADFDYAELANWADKLSAGRHRTLVSRALKSLPTPGGTIGEVWAED